MPNCVRVHLTLGSVRVRDFYSRGVRAGETDIYRVNIYIYMIMYTYILFVFLRVRAQGNARARADSPINWEIPKCAEYRAP